MEGIEVVRGYNWTIHLYRLPPGLLKGFNLRYRATVSAYKIPEEPCDLHWIHLSFKRPLTIPKEVVLVRRLSLYLYPNEEIYVMVNSTGCGLVTVLEPEASFSTHHYARTLALLILGLLIMPLESPQAFQKIFA